MLNLTFNDNVKYKLIVTGLAASCFAYTMEILVFYKSRQVMNKNNSPIYKKLLCCKVSAIGTKYRLL